MLKKYWHINKIWTIQHLIYPARVAIWFIIDIINFVVYPFIWLAIYAHRDLIHGYSKADIVTYYIIVAYVSTVAASHINEHIKKDILRGEISARLLKPFNYLLFRTIQETSYRTIYLVISSAMLLLLFLFGHHYLIPPSSLYTLALFVLSLISAFAIFHCFELIIGLSSFWWGENSALRQAYFTTSVVLSGEIAPLVFFPSIFQRINHYLPFQYLFSFPTQIYLNKLTRPELINGFLGSSAWISTLTIIVCVLWKRGVRGYDGGSL